MNAAGMAAAAKCGILAALLPFAWTAAAQDGASLGGYASRIRERVASAVGRALDGDGAAELSGVVTYAGDGFFYLQRGDEGLKILADGEIPAEGDEVRVAGTPTIEGGRVVLAARNWRQTGRRPVPAPRRATAAELVDADAGRRGVNGTRIVVEGRAIGATEGGFALSVGDVPVNVMVSPTPDFIRDCERTNPKVRATGIAELMLDSSALLGRDGYVMGVKLEVSRPEDVELLPDLAYLAARRDRRLTAAVAVLIPLLAAGVLVFAAVIFRQRRGIFRTRTIMGERKRMADDIHDTIEQHLVGAGMLLQMNRIREAQDVLVRAKREIRDVVWGLKNDDMMRLSPDEMLRKLAHDENVKGICRVDTRLKGLPPQLDAAQMRDLSLIVREAIGNAVKHGGARHVAVSADALEGGGWRLQVANDGAQFDPAAAPGAKDGHFGIEGMRQRARRLNATVDFRPRRGGMVMVLTRAD